MATKKNKKKVETSTEKVVEKKPRYATLAPQEEIEASREATLKAKKAEDAAKKEESKRYETRIFIKKEPIAKNIHVATYAYHESSNQLSITYGQDGVAGADIENLFVSDALIIDAETNAKSMVSRTDNPKLWIQSLYKANLGRPYIAEEAVSYYETE